VPYVAKERKTASLDGFWPTLSPQQLADIEAISLDMWEPYINSIREHVLTRTARWFRKYHVATHLGAAVDVVRRQENKLLRGRGDDRLVRTKYDWLRNPSSFSAADWREFSALR